MTAPATLKEGDEVVLVRDGYSIPRDTTGIIEEVHDLGNDYWAYTVRWSPTLCSLPIWPEHLAPTGRTEDTP